MANTLTTTEHNEMVDVIVSAAGEAARQLAPTRFGYSLWGSDSITDHPYFIREINAYIERLRIQHAKARALRNMEEADVCADAIVAIRNTYIYV